MKYGSFAASARSLTICVTPFLFCAAQGCCGLLEVTETDTQRWVRAEIPPGSTQEVAEKATRRHGYSPTVDPNRQEIGATKWIGGCLPELIDHMMTVTATLDSNGRVTRADASAWSNGP